MKKMVKLIQLGINSCNVRGHAMEYQIESITGKVAFYKCIRCGKTMTVTLKPMPNDIEISGSAVATYCEIK